MQLRLSFRRRRSSSLSEPGRFENAFKSGVFSKQYSFIGCVNGKSASIKKRTGAKLTGLRSKYGKPRTECSVLLHNHNFDFFVNTLLQSNEEESQMTILDSAWENSCLVGQLFERGHACRRMEGKL